MIREQFWKFTLLVCLFFTCIGLLNGEWELILPTMWGIWIYKKEIDELFTSDEPEEAQEELTNDVQFDTKSKIIYTLCHHYAQGLDSEKYHKFMDDTYFFCLNMFEPAGDNRFLCGRCGKYDIEFEHCEDLEGIENDLVCTRCMCDYVIGVCESENDNI